MPSCSAGCIACATSASLLFLDVRDRHGLTQVIVEGDEALLERRPSGSRSEFVVARDRRGRAPLGRHDQPVAADRRGRGAREGSAHPQRGEDAAVLDRRRQERLGRDAAEVPLPRSAPAATAAQHRASPPHHDGAAEVLRRAGLLRDRDADPDQVDAGRRARLPGAEPRAPGRVLRAAAVAADLQADPDDRRLRPLRADRALLPRRGAARRSPARVHAGRPRDVVRHAAARLRRSSKARWPRASREIGVDIPRPFRRMPYAEAMAKYGSDKPDLRFGLEIQDFGPLFARVAVRHLPRGRRARRHDPRLRDSRRGEVLAARGRRARRTSQAGRRRRPDLRALHRGRRAGLGQGRSAKTARARCSRLGREEGRPARARVGRAGRRLEGARPASAAGGEESRTSFRKASGSSPGSPTSRCSTGTPTRSAGIR